VALAGKEQKYFWGWKKKQDPRLLYGPNKGPGGTKMTYSGRKFFD
jgi:hypothetical protein